MVVTDLRAFPMIKIISGRYPAHYLYAKNILKVMEQQNWLLDSNGNPNNGQSTHVKKSVAPSTIGLNL